MANYSRFGDVMLLHPTGRKNGGVASSKAAIKARIDLANKYHADFMKVGEELSIHPAVIAGVASRESNFGASLRKDGWGDNHNAYGMMQCDVRYCPKSIAKSDFKSHKFDSYEHIYMMTKYILIDYIQNVQKKFPSWKAEQQLQGGVAAYNFGLKNVRSWENLDVGTTGNDYSNDVIARAQCLISDYKW